MKCPKCVSEKHKVLQTQTRQRESEVKDMANIGDKYIIEIDSVMTNKKGKLYGIKGFRTLTFDEYGLGQLRKVKYEGEDTVFAIGDEVYTSLDRDGNYLDVGIVTQPIRCGIDNEMIVMSRTGAIYGCYDKSKWHKTGRHFDLDKMLSEVGR